MAANTRPIFPGTIRNQAAALVKDAAAVSLWEAGTDGSRIDKLIAKTATAATLTLSLSDGSVEMQLDPVQVEAGTVVDIMAQPAPWKDEAGSCFLASGMTLKASANQAVTLIAYGGDY